MATEIEAEMARFEEEVLGSDNQTYDSSGQALPGKEIPDLPPPPMFMPQKQEKFERIGNFHPNNNDVDGASFSNNGPDAIYPGPNLGPGAMSGPGPMSGPPPMNNRSMQQDSMSGHGTMMGPGPMMGQGLLSGHNNDIMRGPGQMQGPGPMSNMPGPPMGPGQFMPGQSSMMVSPGAPPGMHSMGSADMGGPPVITSAPKVYSSAPVIMKPPQITMKRKADGSIAGTTSDPTDYPVPSYDKAVTMPQMGEPGSVVGGGPGPTSGPPPMTGPRPMSSSGNIVKGYNSGKIPQPPLQFTQAAAASAYNQGRTQLGKKKRYVRTAAGMSWEDPTLLEWDPNDYRLFCGDLGNEVTDDMLARVFNKYSSFQKARVVRERNSKKTKGYGFVSFKDPNDFIRAMREMNGKYVGNRPIKLRKSNWKDRNVDMVKRKLKEKKKLGYKV